MKEAWRVKLIEALESGEYDKATGHLFGISHRSGEKVHEFCCLGVLCDLYARSDDAPVGCGFDYLTQRFFADHTLNSDSFCTYLIPPSLEVEFGMDRDEQAVLASLNDRSRSFKPIIRHLKKQKGT